MAVFSQSYFPVLFGNFVVSTQRIIANMIAKVIANMITNIIANTIANTIAKVNIRH